MKTNKMFRKRIRITRKGKVLTRTSGHGHFNAKKSRSHQLAIKRTRHLNISTKTLARMLPKNH